MENTLPGLLYGQELVKVFSMDLTLSSSCLWIIPSPGLGYGQYILYPRQVLSMDNTLSRFSLWTVPSSGLPYGKYLLQVFSMKNTFSRSCLWKRPFPGLRFMEKNLLQIFSMLYKFNISSEKLTKKVFKTLYFPKSVDFF